MPSAISGASGAEHEPEAERRGRGEKHAGQIDRQRRRSAGLQPVGGHVPAVAGQAHDREARSARRRAQATAAATSSASVS